MPRQRRVMGPRKKIDLASLREMTREERLRLLTQSFTECGGRSETDWGEKYRLSLSHARSLAVSRPD